MGRWTETDKDMSFLTPGMVFKGKQVFVGKKEPRRVHYNRPVDDLGSTFRGLQRLRDAIYNGPDENEGEDEEEEEELVLREEPEQQSLLPFNGSRGRGTIQRLLLEALELYTLGRLQRAEQDEAESDEDVSRGITFRLASTRLGGEEEASQGASTVSRGSQETADSREAVASSSVLGPPDDSNLAEGGPSAVRANDSGSGLPRTRTLRYPSIGESSRTPQESRRALETLSGLQTRVDELRARQEALSRTTTNSGLFAPVELQQSLLDAFAEVDRLAEAVERARQEFWRRGTEGDGLFGLSEAVDRMRREIAQYSRSGRISERPLSTSLHFYEGPDLYGTDSTLDTDRFLYMGGNNDGALDADEMNHITRSVTYNRGNNTNRSTFNDIARFQDNVKAPESWEVVVIIESVCWSERSLSGVMHAMGVPGSTTDRVSTYFKGEIIDISESSKHLWTHKWDASRRDDAEYWTKLSAFEGVSEQELLEKAHNKDWLREVTEPWILMRWKEVDFLNVTPTQSTLSIAGFYYSALSRESGVVEGIYFDRISNPYQRITLSPATPTHSVYSSSTFGYL